MVTMEEFLNTKEAAEFIKHSEQTLEQWRSKGMGPRFYKPIDKVLYLKKDLIEWVKGENK